MKNKTLAIFGIGTYILSVLSSAADLEGNSTAPIALITISGIATPVFIIMAIIRLWKEARGVSIVLASSAVILLILSVIQVATSVSYGSPIIILLNIAKIINFVAFVWAIATLFKMGSVNILSQRDMAEKLYKDDPDLAMRIAMGEEKAPNGVLSAAVYAQVCDEAEKSENLDICRQLANSFHNSKISAESQTLKFRNPCAAIEKMKEVVNARRKDFEKTLPKGKTIEDAINEGVQDLKKYLMFLENLAQAILNSEKTTEVRIEQIQTDAKQHLKKEQLAKELWILRYAFLYLWFFNIKPAKDQKELTENIALINRAFQNVLSKENKTDYLSWLSKGFAEYAGTNELEFKDLKEFESHFTERVAEKIPLIAFECTEGRLAGKQHDSVIELIQTTIENDRKMLES